MGVTAAAGLLLAGPLLAAWLVRGTSSPCLRIPLDGLRELQGEGVALDGNARYLSSEGGGWIRGGRFMSVRCDLPR